MLRLMVCVFFYGFGICNKNIWKFIANRCIVYFHTVRPITMSMTDWWTNILMIPKPNQTKPPSRWKSRPYRFYYFLPGMEMLSSGYRLLKSSCLLNERNQILNKNKRKNNSIKENSQMVVQTIPLSSVSCYALNLNLLTCALDMYTYSKVHKTFHCIQINSSDDN